MAQDYLVDEANERRNQLIADARMRRLNNIASNAISNGKPTSSSVTPTSNVVWNYGGNGRLGNPRDAISPNSTVVNGYVVSNPQNLNWGFDNLRGTYGSNNGAYPPFSVADTLAQRAQGYQAQGLEGLANSYKTLNKENNVYNNTANKIADYYTQLANDINSRENALAQRKESLANQLSQDIANQRQYVMDYFGPNGIFTNELNKYYDENGNYLASEAGRQMAMANAEGIQSGASLGAQRAARNEAYNNAFQNYLKVKEQELNAKMQIQTQLINYMNALRQEYGDTQNTYVISQYQRANDLLNAISQSMADAQSQILLAQLQKATAGGGTDAMQELAEATYRLEQNEYPSNKEGEIMRNKDLITITRYGGRVAQTEKDFIFDNTLNQTNERRFRNAVSFSSPYTSTSGTSTSTTEESS